MHSSEAILRTNDLSVGFPGSRNRSVPVFENISLSASKAELVALLGANGIGKSTLLRTLVRLQKPLSGDIYLFGRSIRSFSRNELAKKAGFVSTEIIQVNNLSVFDMVAIGRSPHTRWTGRLGEEDILKVNEAINMVGIDSLRHKSINRLSDGERQRAMIARTLAQDTELIVLDEPTAFLDLPNKYEIVNLLHRLAAEKNKTIIFSTHDLGIALQEASKLWLMLDREIVHGAPEDLVLKGAFGKMFSQTNLRFNPASGEFRIERNLSGRASVRGPETECRWTANAIGKLGYSLTGTEDPDIAINIMKQQGMTKWELTMQNEKNAFSSIYDLCTFLTGRKIQQNNPSQE